MLSVKFETRGNIISSDALSKRINILINIAIFLFESENTTVSANIY